jgi:hypothetical protein
VNDSEKENLLRFDKRLPIPGKTPNDEAPGACPACDGGWRTIQFNWRLALAEPRGDWGRYTRTLLRKKTFRRGSLYGCPQCAQAWYLDAAQELMTVISKEKVVFLERWGSKPQTLLEALWLKAKLIGATPAHRLSNDPQYAEVPCRVQTYQGKKIDRCLIVFNLEPPLAEDQSNLLWPGEVAELEPSDFALPLSLRRASCLSRETKPGHAPTAVETPDQKHFLLNWSVNFFEEDGIPGKNLVLAKRIEKRARLVGEPLDQITYIPVDWSPRVGELLGA